MNLFDILKLENELAEFEKETLQEGFWNDNKKSSIILQKIKTIKNKLEKYNKLNAELNNLIEMSELVTLEAEEKQQNLQEENNGLVTDIIEGT